MEYQAEHLIEIIIHTSKDTTNIFDSEINQSVTIIVPQSIAVFQHGIFLSVKQQLKVTV